MNIESNTPTRIRYSIEHVAQFVEWINGNIANHPELRVSLTQEDREMWTRFPAQIRAHRYPHIFIDPDRPILDYLKSGHIGPISPTKSIDN
jgi:hypothetical protein